MSSGDAALDALIEEFRGGGAAAESMDAAGSIEWLRDPVEAEGYCCEISQQFSAFLRSRGLDAFDAGQKARFNDSWTRADYEATFPDRADNPLLGTDFTPDDWGYLDRTREPSTPGPHSATIVRRNGTLISIDWAAAQFGYEQFPLVRTL